MSPKKGLPADEKIIQLLLEHGPKQVKDLMPWLKNTKAKTVHNRCFEMERMGLISRDDDGVWTLKPGVTPESLVTGDLKDKTKQEAKGMVETKGEEKPAGGGSGDTEAVKPLDARGKFAVLVASTGVDKDMVPTIRDQFFNGDINKLSWLRQVLLTNSLGFVTVNQARVIITSWGQFCGLPYNPDDLPTEESSQGKGGKASAKPLSAQLADEAGIGYRVDVDQWGNWKAVVGGPLSYQEALDKAERRATIAAMTAGQVVAGAEEAAEGTEGKQAPKGMKKVESLQDYFMKKVIDEFIEGKKGKGDGESSELVRALQTQISTLQTSLKDMKDQQLQDRLGSMEANLAAIASRDPWSDPAELARARQSLGIPSTTVTDNSPVVQILKDSSDKLDKNVGRLVGLVERVALKSDEFRPEEKRSSEEKEAAASALLTEAASRDRSKALRQRTFGL